MSISLLFGILVPSKNTGNNRSMIVECDREKASSIDEKEEKMLLRSGTMGMYSHRKLIDSVFIKDR